MYGPPAINAGLAGMSDEIVVNGDTFVRMSVAKRRASAEIKKARGKSIEEKYRGAESDKLAHLAHLAYRESALEARNKALLRENGMLERAIQRNRNIYILQRKREHAPVIPWPGVFVVVAIAALLLAARTLL